MFGLAVASIIVAVITLVVAFLIDRRTTKLIRRINAVLVARVKPQELKELERLLGDIENSHEKRGTLVQRQDGSWGIDWVIILPGEKVKFMEK